MLKKLFKILSNDNGRDYVMKPVITKIREKSEFERKRKNALLNIAVNSGLYSEGGGDFLNSPPPCTALKNRIPRMPCQRTIHEKENPCFPFFALEFDE